MLILLQETNVLKSLLSGHEVQLEEGAFGTLSQQILRLYTEVKPTQGQQSQDVEDIPIVSSQETISISSFQIKRINNVTLY